MPEPLTAEQQTLLRLLDEETANYRKYEELLKSKRDSIHDLVGRALRAEIGPSEVTRHTPYDRQHIARIREKHGIPAGPRPGRAASTQQSATSEEH
jgi:hypothetical protein